MIYPRKTALVCLLALVATAAGAGAAWADDSALQARDSERAAKGWHTPLVIPAADFRQDGNDPGQYYFHPTGNIQGEGVSIRLFAPVYLPHGATVHQLTANVYDNATTCDSPDIAVFLRRTRFSDGTWYGMGYVDTDGASGWPQQISDTLITNALIDNVDYVYYVFVSMCSSVHELMSVNIYYSE